MASVKAIKQRIVNVQSTKQIMKAMDMVSSAKLQKARARLETSRPLYEEASRIIERLKNHPQVAGNRFVECREIKNTAYIIITGDRGLCGSYNIRVAQEALSHMSEGRNEKILAIGSKGYEYFKRRDKHILRRLPEISEAQMYFFAGHLSEEIIRLYLSGEVDEVYVAYTYFRSTLNCEPRLRRLLPVARSCELSPGELRMKYEPDPNVFLENALPLYLHAALFSMMAESSACEHASRMVNMEAASKNASDIIDDLNRLYNRKRQAAITQELNEIVSGANTLK